MTRYKSRPTRWAEACAEARSALDNLEAAFSDLTDLKDEYQEWRDSMPDGLDQSATAEKLDAVTELDFEVLDEVGSVLDEAEGIDLPRGWGND